MIKQLNELTVELKEAREGVDFYPTTRDMVRRIWRFQSDKHSAITVSEKCLTSGAANATSGKGTKY